MAREALRRVLHGARGDVAVTHGAPSRERLQAGIGSRRHHRAAHPERYAAAVPVDESVHVERPRPAADPGNGPGLPALRQMHDHRRNPCNAHLIAVDHTERQDGGDAGVDGVTAGLEHFERRQRGQLVTRADRVVMSMGCG